jgi:hypothetical protein
MRAVVKMVVIFTPTITVIIILIFVQKLYHWRKCNFYTSKIVSVVYCMYCDMGRSKQRLGKHYLKWE